MTKYKNNYIRYNISIIKSHIYLDLNGYVELILNKFYGSNGGLRF